MDTDRNTVDTMGQASKEALQTPAPTEVRLSGGETVCIRELGWVEALPFIDEFNRIARVLPKLMRTMDTERSISEREFSAYMPGGFLNAAAGTEIGRVEAEQTKALIEALQSEKVANAEQYDNAINDLMGRLDVAPQTLFKLVCVATDKPQEFYSNPTTCKYSEVMRLAFYALRINVFENANIREIRDFFGVGRRQPSGVPAE